MDTVVRGRRVDRLGRQVRVGAGTCTHVPIALPPPIRRRRVRGGGVISPLIPTHPITQISSPPPFPPLPPIPSIYTTDVGPPSPKPR